MRLKLFLVALLLTSCTNPQSNPVPVPSRYQPITSTTAVATYASIPTPAMTPTATLPEIIVSSKGNRIFLRGFLDHVNSLAWSRDGKTLIIASQQEYLVFFDVQSKEVTINPASDSAISSITLSPDQKTLAVISAGPLVDIVSVHFINLETGHVIQTIEVERTPIFEGDARIVYGGTGIFAPDGKTFILNSGRQITLWNVASGSQIKKLFECNSNFFVAGLILNPTKNLLFTIYYEEYLWGKEKTFLRWDTNTWKLTKTFKGKFESLTMPARIAPQNRIGNSTVSSNTSAIRFSFSMPRRASIGPMRAAASRSSA